MFLNILYRVVIISTTLSVLNNQSIFKYKFLFNIITTSMVFLITNMINDYLKEDYEGIKKRYGYDFMPVLVSPIIISILYVFRHICEKSFCKKFLF